MRLCSERTGCCMMVLGLVVQWLAVGMRVKMQQGSIVLVIIGFFMICMGISVLRAVIREQVPSGEL